MSSLPQVLAASLALHPLVRTLPDGLVVVVREDHRAPVVATSMLLGVGSGEDDPPGLAHLQEHLAFAGSAAAPGGAYDLLLAEAGADGNAWTSEDWTVLQAHGPPGALGRILFLEADRMEHPRFGAEALDRQRRVVAEERSGRTAGDRELARMVMQTLLWPQGHPYHLPVLGTRDGLEGVGLQAVLAHRAAWYGPGDGSLVIVGDVDAREAFDMAARAFAGVHARPHPPRREAPPPERPGEDRAWLPEPIDDERLLVGWNTVPHGDPDEAALDVLAALLAGQAGDSLDEALSLRGRRPLAVSATAWTDNARLGGVLVIEVAGDDGPLAPRLRAVDRALERLRRRGPDPAEVERIVARWETSFLEALEDPVKLADALNDCLATTGSADCLGESLGRYAAVDAGAVRRVARRYLGPGRVLLSVVSPGDGELALPGSRKVEPP